MDKDRIEGSARQAKGAFRRFLGRLFGDKKLEAEGTLQREVGKFQNAAGGIKDNLRGK